jgi:3-hydroxymyristoyl/3-hydroxydecanoyl-(acyl carrier protein) dehydratase
MMNERTIALFANPEHPAFPGHFPDMPIVPGVVLLDWTIAAIASMEKRRILPGQLQVAKFLGTVPPGAQLLLHYRIDAGEKIVFRIEFEMRVVVTGTLLAQGAVNV